MGLCAFFPPPRSKDGYQCRWEEGATPSRCTGIAVRNLPRRQVLVPPDHGPHQWDEEWPGTSPGWRCALQHPSSLAGTKF